MITLHRCTPDQPRLPLRLAAAICAAVLAVASFTRPAVGETACLAAGSDQSVVEGRLGLQEGLGPAAFIVILPQGVCLDGPSAQDKVEKAYSVQLFANTAEGFQDLYRMAGERVYVRGKASAARTFQQRAPILLEVIEIATK